MSESGEALVPLPPLDGAAVARKRSVSIDGHPTSFSLEEPFWKELRAMAAETGQSVAAIVRSIDRARGAANLSGAIRVVVLARCRATGLAR